jgi:MOSC domain-containing protein YiiM
MIEHARLVCVNVGLPREIVSNGERVTTGIFKYPTDERVMLRRLNLDGDRQADLSVHGGEYKAAYAYPAEHYPYWRGQFPDMELDCGAFGENFTTEGVSEDEVCLGDRFRVGEAEVVVTQPRLPCFKLALRFGREDIIKKFLDSFRTGFYLSVAIEGRVGAGDKIEAVERHPDRIRVTDIVRLYARDKSDLDALRRVVSSSAVIESWRVYFRRRLKQLER